MNIFPTQGEIPQRVPRARSSPTEPGVTTTLYALDGVQERGVLFIGDGVEVYEGMLVGEHSRDNDLDVNCGSREEADEHACLGLR